MHDDAAHMQLPRTLLITGGASCGKSSYAEYLSQFVRGRRLYIATLPILDAEGERRVARHRTLRKDRGFETIECQSGLSELDFGLEGASDSLILLECLTSHISNLLRIYENDVDTVCSEVLRGIAHVQRQCAHLFVVSNEVGCGLGAYNELTQSFIYVMGKVQAALAADFDAFAEVVCGIPVYHKGSPYAGFQPAAREGSAKMVLIVGGESSGKRAYAQSLGVRADDIADAVIDGRTAICNVHQLISRRVDEELSGGAYRAEIADGKEMTIAADLLDELASKQVIICNEVGSGVVPASSQERIVREQVGTFCALAAAQADVVVRMVCGIPMYLKGSAETLSCLSR